MAELILKTSTNGPDPQWQDGDIIHAMNDLRIHDVHAQHICHKNLIGFNGDGLRPVNSLTEMYLANTRQYKFERISAAELKRIDLTTLDEEVLSDTPNAKGEYIDVVLYLQRRKQHPKHLIFGSSGSEIWYGGRTLITDTRIDGIWTLIESQTANLRADHDKFPWGKEDQKDHLVITVDDFDNTVRAELEVQVYDIADPPVMTKRRKNKVDWRNLPGLTQKIIDDTLDNGVEVEIRDTFSFTRSQIVEAKAV
jgi:hypothetical protein